MSKLKVNRLENTATANGGIDIDASGHVQFDGLQLPTAGALSNRNLVINGAMQVAQRGTSSSSNGYGCVDRWRATFSGASGTQSQLSLTSGDPYDEGFRRAFRLEITSPSSATSGYIQMRTHLEGQTIAQSGWKYTDSNQSLTCSFWVRSSLAGTYNVQYRASDSGNFFFNRAFTVTANTWTKVTHTIPGHSSLVFNNDTGDGFQIVIVPQYGTNHTDNSVSNNTWFTLSNSYFPDYAQSFLNTDNATFDVTGVQLEVGSKATPFEHRSYGDELQRCLRYFYKPDCEGDARQKMMGISYGANAYYIPFEFPVPMRVGPSIPTEGGGNWRSRTNNVNYFDVTWTTHGTATTTNQMLATSGGSISAGTPFWFETHDNSGCSLEFDAEL